MLGMPTVVGLSILILGSVLLSVILILVCGKRKLIQRKECFRRDPHVPGQEARKVLKKEIERRIDRASEIYNEPHLITGDSVNSQNFPPYYFRMKAVDNMKYLEDQLSAIDGVPARTLRETVRSFLINLGNSGGVLDQMEAKVLHELCDYFDHARHHPASFGPEQLAAFNSLFTKVLHSARRRKRSKHLSNVSKAPSDHDSAIDEPEQGHSDDDNLLNCEANMFLLKRPSSLKLSTEEDYETSV